MKSEIKSDLRWTPFIMLCYREIRRFMKVLIQTVLTPIMNSSLYFLIFGLSLNITIPGVSSYLAFLIPGLVMMGCLNNSFQNASSSVVSSKFSGELEDYKAAPLSHQQFIWALAFGGVVRGFLVAIIIFAVGQGFYYIHYSHFFFIAHPLILFFFLLVGGLSFAKLGLSVAIWSKTFDQMSAVGNFIITPLIYLGGVFFSIDRLPEFWQQVSKFNPLFYLINGVRYGVLDQSDVSMASAILIATFSLACFHILALYSLKKGSFVRW